MKRAQMPSKVIFATVFAGFRGLPFRPFFFA